MQTILIIEDEEPLRLTLSDRLNMEGFRVQTARDGTEGLNQALTEPPDLILCDIMMPGMDGYAVLQNLRMDDRTASIPFIFLTAKADPPQVRVGMELGANDYLCKPVSKADLLAAIRAQLDKHQQEQRRLEKTVEAAQLHVVNQLPRELLAPLEDLLKAGKLLETTASSVSVPKVREIGRSICLASHRLQRTIRRFLLYAELRMAGPLNTPLKVRGSGHVSVTSLTGDLARRLAQQDSRSDDLQLDLREVKVSMDLNHYSDLVIELLDNAFKYSVPGSVVRVILSALPNEEFLLEVRDQGRGMTSDQVQQVGAFRQFDRDLLGQSGTGLGLTLVKQLTTLYKGSCEIDSDPGNGTRVTLRLPNGRPGT